MNRLKLILYTSTAIIVAFLLITVWFFNSNYSILDISDIKMMIEDNKDPAITIPTTNKQYFNRWQCFNVNSIEIATAEIDYNGKQIVPYIQVNLNKRSLQFNVDPVINKNTKTIIDRWKKLIEQQKKICIFAAYLQTDPDGTTVWYIDKIKTKAGYWDFAE